MGVLSAVYVHAMKYNGVILKKLGVLDDELSRLRELGALNTDQLSADHFLKHGIERSLQICVEIVIDVAQRILSLEERAPAANSFAALEALASLGVIADCERYRNMVQFRNFVVHRYERVDSVVLVDILANHLDDLDQFRREVMQS